MEHSPFCQAGRVCSGKKLYDACLLDWYPILFIGCLTWAFSIRLPYSSNYVWLTTEIRNQASRIQHNIFVLRGLSSKVVDLHKYVRKAGEYNVI